MAAFHTTHALQTIHWSRCSVRFGLVLLGFFGFWCIKNQEHNIILNEFVILYLEFIIDSFERFVWRIQLALEKELRLLFYFFSSLFSVETLPMEEERAREHYAFYIRIDQLKRMAYL